jgi:SSS family solute:Na+ symporter
MATKNVDEGRKAATFNILFMLPLSAIVVGNAGWIGKAISVTEPNVVPPNTNPDEIFVVVASLVALPGVFGFIMASLTAALMSTVDTLINATSAIYINDIYRPIKKFLKSDDSDKKKTDKRELTAARISSIAITILGVLSVLAFQSFPTVYEAHGFFHSTLTPPLVVAIFLGLFWRKYTASGVITTFVGGVAFMILGLHDPIVISPFDHGIMMDPNHPYSYIRALYNMLVCFGVAVIITYSTDYQRKVVAKIKALSNGKTLMYGVIFLTVVFFLMVSFNIGSLPVQFILIALIVIFTALSVHFFIKYDDQANTDGLTVWSVQKAKEYFKGSKVNEEEGEVIKVHWKLKEGDDEETVNFSVNDMKKMKANVGDLVYISDARKYLGGLKSVHVKFGEPHNEDGIVYITNEEKLNGQFIEGRILTAEKEM